MINLIIWFASFLCPNPNHTIEGNGSSNLVHVTTNAENETGGETGGTPKPPPPPPPPGG